MSLALWQKLKSCITTADELENRLITFGVNILRVVRVMPSSPDAKHLASQIIRSGTSPGLHYGEVRGAESTADFRHKLKVVYKELRETRNALRMIRLMKDDYVPVDIISETLLKECTELVTIIGSSLKTLDQKRLIKKS